MRIGDDRPWGSGRLLVIGGFAKAGSSALFDTISAMPSVCPSIEKEPYFFVDEANDRYQSFVRPTNHAKSGIDSYRTVFDPSRRDRPVKLDGSGNYIFQRTALEMVPALPDVVLAVTVRRPALRVLSLFRWMRDQICLVPAETDLHGFLATGERQGYAGPAGSVLNGAVEHSRYAQHLRSWNDAMGSRVVVVRVDCGPEALGSDLAELGVRSHLGDMPHTLERTNVTERMRSPHLAKLAFAFGTSRQWPFKRTRAYARVRTGYRRINSTGARRPLSEADLDAVMTLDTMLADEIDALEDLVRLDLSAWRRPLEPNALD